MIGMEEYPMLGIENAEEQYHAQIGMLAKYPEIPLWDYGAGIKAFRINSLDVQLMKRVRKL